MRFLITLMLVCCAAVFVAAEPKTYSFSTYNKCTMSPVPNAPQFFLEICQYYLNSTSTKPIGNDTHIVYPENIALPGHQTVMKIVSFGFLNMPNLPPVKYSDVGTLYEADATDPNSLIGITSSFFLYSLENNTIIGSATLNDAAKMSDTEAPVPWNVIIY